MDSIAELTTHINAFRDARDWKQFHNPKDMALSISIEAAELMEQFQWKNAAECEEHLRANREAVADEIRTAGGRARAWAFDVSSADRAPSPASPSLAVASAGGHRCRHVIE